MSPRFSSPPDPIEFNAQVWEIVRQIPPGKVMTYGQVAAKIPIPNGVEAENYRAVSPRWVGGAMAKCPPDVPWQRVINAQGKISVRGGSEQQQRRLLEEEGIVFDNHNKIDLHRYAWSGSDNNPVQPQLF